MNEAVQWTVRLSGDDEGRTWDTVEAFTQEQALDGFKTDESHDWLKVASAGARGEEFVRIADINRFWVRRPRMKPGDRAVVSTRSSSRRSARR